jgi:flagellin
MAQTINTNIASLTAQRNLATSQKDAATAMQRLSSGLRINSAKDDAAGLAISNRLTSQINGLNQAVRNANDGLSVAQVAEGALAETSDILQRMRELSVQSANASNSAADRTALQTEVAQLSAEVERIANVTKFGDTSLLNGTFSAQNFQVGSGVGESIGVTMSSAKASALGQLNSLSFTSANFETGSVSTAATKANNESYIEAQTLTFAVGPAGDTTSYTVAVADNASAADIASSITANVANVSATAQTIFRLTDDTSAALAAGDTVDVELNGVALTGIDASSIANFMAAFEVAVESESSLSNLTVNSTTTYAEVIDTSGNNVTFGITSINDAANATAMDFILSVDAYTNTAASGSASAITSTGSGTVDPGASGATGATAKDVFVTVSGTTSLFAQDSTLQYTIQSSVDISSAGGIGENSAAQTGTVTSLNLQVDDIDVSTVSGAEQGIQIIDAAIAEINSQRAVLGAVQSRFDSVVSNLMNVSENTAAARSRIMDADFASETAMLAKTQILQQAGISVLAQANAQPQNVLALLQ